MTMKWLSRKAAALLAAVTLPVAPVAAAPAGAATGTAALPVLPGHTGPKGHHGGEPTFGPAPALKMAEWAKAQAAADRRRRQAPPATTPLKGVELAPATAAAPRAAAAASSALVLYDSTGPYGFLGELYGMATANLAGHFGTVKAKPVSQYTAGEVEQHTATIYIGSTYYGGSVPDAVPNAFYADVAATARPVVWVNNNIWTLAGKIGVPAFTAKYGWDPTQSFFDPVGGVTRVDYRNQPLTRTVPAGSDGGVLRPRITNPSAVTSLATAQDTSTTPATSFPWAIRSANLTYLGEIPYAYVKETDRIIAWHDLLFDALAPGTAIRHRAVLRLEDISPASDPAQLTAVAQYLAAQRIPYAFQVIPVYTDPRGANNDGVPETITLAQRPQVLNALKYMVANGGRIVAHGYTHQYRNVQNPYSGTTGDDFEFFRAHIDAKDSVVLDGPVPEDSATWASSRIGTGKAAYAPAGLPTPTIWTTPHYAASAVDYGAVRQHYAARLERSLYFSGQLTGGSVDGRRYIGQFFPYPVRDIGGATVLPENLGNYEPEAQNNNPLRTPADIIRAAQYNLAVRDGFASTFYHPYHGTGPLSQIVSGIRGLGYTFVDPGNLAP
ncbi:DUF2334 domain-containing protein [Actinomadura graeca]|uniref:DUF2334 domain-containing protein n=1 Tax=Actinomadura graeca TaxID=2750812 RepID=A0ABX8R012_9ACTN|nr:polysaccharide deacetylase family protein [Actinomadura graeca]QXJ23779.1 DUF2334 domain-containing protein [Actinomadura graeca]